jgi:hypothetical protein
MLAAAEHDKVILETGKLLVFFPSAYPCNYH